MSRRLRDARASTTGQAPDPATGAVVHADHACRRPSSRRRSGKHAGYEYARSGNPTRRGVRGVPGVARGRRRTASRSRAAWRPRTRCCACSRPGQRVIIPDDAYGGTFRLVSKVLAPAGIEWTRRRPHRSRRARRATGPTAPRWCGSRRPPTRRSPSSTSLGVCAVAHERGARVVVDNTFATPVPAAAARARRRHRRALGHEVPRRSLRRRRRVRGHQRPRDRRAHRVPAERGRRGAEPVRLLPRAARASRRSRCAWSATATTRGASPRCSLVHPAVSTRALPGLPDHPGPRRRASPDARLRRHGELPRRRRRGRRARASSPRTRLFTLAESLGGVESLIEHPARMTHASAADSPLAVDPALVRLSVGIETTDDLVADLHQALDAVSTDASDLHEHPSVRAHVADNCRMFGVVRRGRGG